MQVLVDLVVEAFRMRAEHAGDVHRERAVDEDRYGGQPVLIHELMQQENQLLGAPYGERGNDQAAAARDGACDDFFQRVDRVAGSRVFPAAVGAFHDEVVAWRKRFGIADNGQSGSAHVAENASRTLPSVKTIDEEPRICPAS